MQLELQSELSHHDAAMQMGLGKTAQSIASLEFQRQLCQRHGPFLVCLACSDSRISMQQLRNVVSLLGTAT